MTMNHPEIGDSFEWRGTTWKRGLSPDSFFPAVPLTKGMRRSDAEVFRDMDGIRWRASIKPTPNCSARGAAAGTPGATPQEALDGEVVIWLMTALMLPGARELLAEVAECFEELGNCQEERL